MHRNEPDVVYAKSRPRCCQVGTLAQARDAFNKTTGLSIAAPIDDENFPESEGGNILPYHQPVVRGNGYEGLECTLDDVPF